jgi:ubiquitin carboxyl-terminal hydrolase 8
VSTMNGSNAGGIKAAKGSGRILAHLDDLISVTPDVDINEPIRRIIQQAETLAKSAESSLDFKRPDVALQDFIKASIIIMEIVPRHKDYLQVSPGSGEDERTTEYI